MLLHFEEVGVVDYGVDHIFHVIGKIRLCGDNLVQRGIGAVDWIGAGFARGVVKIIRGHKAQQLAHHRQALGVIMREKVRYA